MLIPVVLVVSVTLLVLAAGFFSGSETVFTSVSKTFLHAKAEEGDPRAIAARKMLSNAERFLGITLAGTNLAISAATTLAALLLAGRGVPPQWVSVVNTIIMTPIVLVAADFVPKSIGWRHSEKLALTLARPMRTVSIILLPLAWFASRIAGAVARLFGGSASSGFAPRMTREDLQALAELAVEQQLVPEAAGEMMNTVFELANEEVSAVMQPLVDVYSVPLDAGIDAVERLSVKTGHTRFPVYQNRIDEIVGIVDLRDLLYAPAVAADIENGRPNMPIEPFIQRNIAYMPETKSVGSLLHELQYQNVPMAIVVDEHGGVVGIVTTEDLIEEVVGEIQDERDLPESVLKKVEPGVYDCDGKVEVRRLLEELDLSVDKNGFETVAGLVLKLAEHIPTPGETFDCNGYTIEVLAATRRRVTKVRFRRTRTPRQK